MSKLDPKSPYKATGKDIKIKVDLSNYATKTDLKMWHMLILLVLH